MIVCLSETLRGVVREKGSPRPIVGAELSIQNQQAKQSEQVVTDVIGRFECFMLPGSATVGLAGPFPGGLFSENPYLTKVTVPDDVTLYDMPLIEVVRGRTIAGRVVDDDGKGVAGAKVRLVNSTILRGVDVDVIDNYPVIHRRYTNRYHYTLTAITNSRGEFVLEGIEPVDDRGVKKLERAICYCILSSCKRLSKVISAAGSLLRYPPARTGFQRLGRLRN